MTRVQRLVELVRPVGDLARAVRFYTQALGFVEEPASGYALLAEAWGSEPSALARLRLGSQTILLAACDDTPQPPDSGSTDTRFQHFAIVTPDMAASWQRLLAHGPLTAISQGGPQRLPASSGGVDAVKFRDPDGHPLEFLGFPGDKRSPGIDHSAIGVADVDVSIAFYADRLGLSQASRQLNQGPEQARLDGLAEPRVDVVGLQPAEPTPHLELLGYRPARAPSTAANGPRTTTVWSGATTASWLSDPDGHLHLLTP